jgi:CRISPR-associated protein Csd2
MGRKYIVPYGLYRAHGFISASLAGDDKKGTGFSEDDLELFWQALLNMFDHDRSAARGEMSSRKLILFKHAHHLGNAPAQALFERVKVERLPDVKMPRGYHDYIVSINHMGLPEGVEIIERL